jgi:hypothetical protein
MVSLMLASFLLVKQALACVFGSITQNRQLEAGGGQAAGVGGGQAQPTLCDGLRPIDAGSLRMAIKLVFPEKYIIRTLPPVLSVFYNEGYWCQARIRMHSPVGRCEQQK